jgi:hypothetical protein
MLRDEESKVMTHRGHNLSNVLYILVASARPRARFVIYLSCFIKCC